MVIGGFIERIKTGQKSLRSGRRIRLDALFMILKIKAISIRQIIITG